MPNCNCSLQIFIVLFSLVSGPNFCDLIGKQQMNILLLVSGIIIFNGNIENYYFQCS